MPTQAGDYDQKSPQLSGPIAPNREDYNRVTLEGRTPDDTDVKTPPLMKFASRIEQRSKDDSGGGRCGRVGSDGPPNGSDRPDIDCSLYGQVGNPIRSRQ